MDIEAVKNEILKIDWDAFIDTEYYIPEKVPECLVRLITLEDEKNIDAVYNNLLFAIGNNHAGTYYHAVKGALQFIINTALDGNSEAAGNCAISILTDLYCSFYPDFYCVKSEAEADELHTWVNSRIESLKDSLKEIVSANKESERNLQSIHELIGLIELP